MSHPNAAESYVSQQVLTADPVTITTMLYDGALKAMRKARLLHEAGNRKGFLDETGRAHLIIGELLSTLDMEAGGEIAVNLSAVYAYCIRHLIECTLGTGDLDKLAEAEKHIARITEAWKQATASLRASTSVATSAEAAA